MEQNTVEAQNIRRESLVAKMRDAFWADRGRGPTNAEMAGIRAQADDVVRREGNIAQGTLGRMTDELNKLILGGRGQELLDYIGIGASGFGGNIARRGGRFGDWMGRIGGQLGGGIGATIGKTIEAARRSTSLIEGAESPAERMQRALANLEASRAMNEITPEAFAARRRQLLFEGIGQLHRPGFHPLSAVESRTLTRGADTPQVDQLQLAVQQKMKEELERLRTLVEDNIKKGGLEVEIRGAR
jgi:hypothetical protein